MDLRLMVEPETNDALVASYTCPCGCNPHATYAKGAAHAVDGCCCGNTFAVGPDAGRRLIPTEGFALEVQPFDAPWGGPLEAAWLIGPSTHADDDHGDDHGHEHGNDHEHAGLAPGSALDPVCGMTVDIEIATERDLHLVHAGTDYYFCGRGCKLEFGDDPGKYLDPAYVPSM